VIQGRAFTAEDHAGAPNVVIINDVLARSYFRDQDPIGQRIVFDRTPDSSSVWRTIVGVVGSEHQQSLAMPPRNEIFAPFPQEPRNGGALVIRRRCPSNTSCDPMTLVPFVRRAVGEIDPLLALGTPHTMVSVHADSLARQRFLMTLLLVFAVVGLSLAVVGVYGVLAHLARRRTREMGIRIALGARASQVRWLVVRHGLRLTITGLVIGGIAALAFTRALSGLLYRITPGDPLTIVAVALVLAATSFLASWLPAIAASRADPAIALRAE
jgi:putative ABC transport system permease protein